MYIYMYLYMYIHINVQVLPTTKQKIVPNNKIRQIISTSAR